MDGRTIETTTLREDVETDGRHAKVAFGRDFSADALPARLHHQRLVARARTARCTILSAASTTLRPGACGSSATPTPASARTICGSCVSFASPPGSARARSTRKASSAAIRNRLALAGLSRERVRAETLKLLVAPHAGAVLRTMGESGILEQTVGFAWTARFNSAIAIEVRARSEARRCASAGGARRRDPRRRRAPARRLRLANAEYERIAQATEVLTGLHGIATPPPADQLRVLLFLGGTAGGARRALSRRGRFRRKPRRSGLRGADRFLAEAPAPELPVSGSDLIARGVEEGPRVGEVLRIFRRRWIEASFPSDRRRSNGW